MTLPEFEANCSWSISYLLLIVRYGVRVLIAIQYAVNRKIVNITVEGLVWRGN